MGEAPTDGWSAWFRDRAAGAGDDVHVVPESRLPGSGVDALARNDIRDHTQEVRRLDPGVIDEAGGAVDGDSRELTS